MKQEKGRTFSIISKGVKSTRSKLKQTAISTPIKNAPLTAKVNSTWNNVLNKNKDCTIGKISAPNKFEIDLAQNDPVNSLRYFLAELKNKIFVLLPGNRAVKNIMDNILKTFANIEQPIKIQNPKPTKSKISHPQLPAIHTQDMDDGLRQKIDQLNVNLKEKTEENLKLRKQKEDMESQLHILKNELNASKERVEQLESTLNETVNTERETIANYEQQCKRLENEIKTLQDSASQLEHLNSSAEQQTQLLDRMEKFKNQTQIAFRELEKEKLLTILKYDKNQMNTTYSEFCKIYELIQQYFTSDHSQELQILLNAQINRKK
ncbi:uncharacterized protein LOC119075326 isoform X2 [Bradysia coprophila]|uniref:uncharacterized protein LOC119075326 isoform X2 n=1 Tax=Bradysia coprophila TaxID=38358 RepID=UPI00187D8793|nr:uncharacterized protein LOC119075326 isoform X2 [Bradysia coprophila]